MDRAASKPRKPVDARAAASATDRAVEHIRNRILFGELETGATLSEEALSRELGLSRTPIREALRVLQTRGFVRLERFRGAIVTNVSTRDVWELYDLRACLERHAITEALRGGEPLDLGEIRAAIAGHQAALDDPGAEAMLRAIETDRAFHFGILGLHGNRRIQEILEATWDQVIRCSWQIMQRHPVQAESHVEHVRLLDALERRDLQAALAASEVHLRNARHRLLLAD
jgi:DNA-binding GntR family transcriptional regulator